MKFKQNGNYQKCITCLANIYLFVLIQIWLEKLQSIKTVQPNLT